MQSNLSTIGEASRWAAKYLNRPVNSSNISYLIQYAKIDKHKDENGKTLVDIEELKEYYDNYIIPRENSWKRTLGEDTDWHLSFDQLDYIFLEDKWMFDIIQEQLTIKE